MAYKIIKSEHLSTAISFHRPDEIHKKLITLEDPAINVMTDLKRVSLVTIGPKENIDTALDKMRNRGVRLLIVVDAHDHITGVVTATDILGEKPVQFAKANDVKHNEITVGDIMSNRVEVFTIADVSKAKVGDLVRTLKQVDRQHAIVVDNQGPNNDPTVRGIISMTQIARQLGKTTDTFDIDKMFQVIMN